MKNNNRRDAIVDELYKSISTDVVDIIEDPDISDFITVLELLCRVSAMVEVIRIGDRPIRGTEKKEIVQYFGRFLIEKHCREELLENVLEIYDSSSSHAIETIINFAKNNKVIKKATKCATFFC